MLQLSHIHQYHLKAQLQQAHSECGLPEDNHPSPYHMQITSTLKNDTADFSPIIENKANDSNKNHRYLKFHRVVGE